MYSNDTKNKLTNWQQMREQWLNTKNRNNTIDSKLILTVYLTYHTNILTDIYHMRTVMCFMGFVVSLEWN